MKDRRLASTCLVMLTLIALPPFAFAQSQCGPFGDPPAIVQTGLLASFIAEHSPTCLNGRTLGPWRDDSGVDRFACLYQPASADDGKPRPLLVFLHGSLASADSVLVTNLIASIDGSELGGSGSGYILLAPEGREITHHYPPPDEKGLGWDNWYRQLNPSGSMKIAGIDYPENADAEAIDHFVQEQIAANKVDRHRIYITGWSNGAAMAILYALNRPQIAAAAVYSAPDPLGAFNDPCPQTPVAKEPSKTSQVQVFNPKVPIMHVQNSCDIGGICPNGVAMAGELGKLGLEFKDVIIDAESDQVAECEAACGTDSFGDGTVPVAGSLRGAKNHLLWPKAWTTRMLEFLRDHPHK